MSSYKENSNFFLHSHLKTPYSRPNNLRTEPIVSRIIKKARTCENNHEKPPIRGMAFSLRSNHTNPIVNYEEPSTSYAEDVAYDSMDDVYGITVTRCYSKSMRNRSECEPVHFRPRKTKLAHRSLDNAFDHSMELKMMTIDDKLEVSENSKKSKPAQETPTKSFQIKTRQNLLRIFTGSVENVLHWSKLKTGLHILFEVTATVGSIQQGKWKSEKKFFLTDYKSGPKLQVSYQEIDRPLPKLHSGSLVTCTGRLITRNLLQAYKVEECSQDQKNDLQRLSFICNRVADELVAASQKKSP